MRRLLLTLLLLLLPVPAWATITFTELQVGAGQSSGTNGVTFTATPSGGLVTCGIRVNTTGRTVAWSDDQGNTWVDGTSQVYNSSGDEFFTAYALNATTSVVNVLTVTATVSGAAVFTRVICMSHAGVAISSALDQINKNAGSGAVADGGAVTTTCANEVVVLYTASTANAGAPTGGGGGFTERGVTENDTAALDRIVSSTGTYTGTETYPGSGAWAGIAMSFADTAAPCSSATNNKPKGSIL